MKSRHHLVGAFLWPLAVQGCTLNPPDPVTQAAYPVSMAEDPPVRAAASSETRFQAEPPAEALELSGELTLREALVAALAGNPELQSFSWAVRAADAETLQAGVRPNPDLFVETENFVGGGAYANQVQFQNTLQLSQFIELGDKRERRSEVAARIRDKASAEYEAKRVEVLGATTLDFIEVLGDQERLKLAELAVRQAEKSFHAAERRVQAGIGSRLETARTKILVARTKIKREHVEHELETSRRTLAARWGGRTAPFAEVVGELFAPHAVPTLEELEARVERAPSGSWPWPRNGCGRPKWPWRTRSGLRT